MYREYIYSTIGHAIVFCGLVFPSLLEGKSQTVTTVYSVKTVTPRSIEQLLNRSSPQGTPKPKIPQVTIKPDRPLPKKNWRPKQTVKSTADKSSNTSGSTTSGTQSTQSPVSGIAVDAEFDYPEYLIDMRNKIERSWKPPTVKTSLKTRVYFKLDKNGRILRTYIESRTGNMTFDMAAMNAVTKSAPFPPLPDEFPGENIGIHMDFIYEQ